MQTWKYHRDNNRLPISGTDFHKASFRRKKLLIWLFLESPKVFNFIRMLLQNLDIFKNCFIKNNFGNSKAPLRHCWIFCRKGSQSISFRVRIQKFYPWPCGTQVG